MALALLTHPLHAQFAYVANAGSGNVSGYTINPTTGALTPISGSPFAVGSGAGPLAVDPNGKFAYGYCTWYVANRRYVPWFGNAIDWWPNARTYGYPEGPTPVVGSIMVSRESPIGHVAYVESVSGDGSFVVSEMNYAGWNIVDNRTIRPGQVPVVGFIYGN